MQPERKLLWAIFCQAVKDATNPKRMGDSRSAAKISEEAKTWLKGKTRPSIT